MMIPKKLGLPVIVSSYQGTGIDDRLEWKDDEFLSKVSTPEFFRFARSEYDCRDDLGPA